MKWPIRVRASPRSKNTAVPTHSRHNVPQKRSIFPSVCGRRGEATTWRIPRCSNSLAKALLPRQVTYCVPLSVRISSGVPCEAIAARSKVKQGDASAEDDVERAIAEQAVGFHLLQVNEPIAKTGAVLKDWANLWNRPAFAAWSKKQASAKMLAQMRVTAPPAGVTLPKDTVHLEIVLPRPDIEELPPMPPARPGDKPAPVMPKPDAGAAARPFDYDASIQPERERPDAQPGAILRLLIDTEHWLSAGQDGESQTMIEGNRVFAPLRLDRGRNVARYAGKDRLIASGLIWPENQDLLVEKAFLMHQPAGQGHVIAFAEDANYRAFSEATMLLFMNAVLLGPAY